jgi:hypothetical protein
MQKRAELSPEQFKTLTKNSFEQRKEWKGMERSGEEGVERAFLRFPLQFSPSLSL